jgi:multisubunit Na+/H+ antiporter MnhF subunit
MRIKRSHLLFLAVLALSAVTWYVGSAELEPHLASLASQPHVKTAFVDPDTGTSDALMALISFSILAPLAAFVAIMIVLFLVKFVETVLVSAHAPGWPSTPMVGIALVATLYTTSQAWIPTSLYTLGLVARAYFVYRYGGALPGIH